MPPASLQPPALLTDDRTRGSSWFGMLNPCSNSIDPRADHAEQAAVHGTCSRLADCVGEIDGQEIDIGLPPVVAAG
jgi:hypothetical protein